MATEEAKEKKGMMKEEDAAVAANVSKILGGELFILYYMLVKMIRI